MPRIPKKLMNGSIEYNGVAPLGELKVDSIIELKDYIIISSVISSGSNLLYDKSKTIVNSISIYKKENGLKYLYSRMFNKSAWVYPLDLDNTLISVEYDDLNTRDLIITTMKVNDNECVNLSSQSWNICAEMAYSYLKLTVDSLSSRKNHICMIYSARAVNSFTENKNTYNGTTVLYTIDTDENGVIQNYSYKGKYQCYRSGSYYYYDACSIAIAVFINENILGVRLTPPSNYSVYRSAAIYDYETLSMKSEYSYIPGDGGEYRRFPNCLLLVGYNRYHIYSEDGTITTFDTGSLDPCILNTTSEIVRNEHLIGLTDSSGNIYPALVNSQGKITRISIYDNSNLYYYDGKLAITEIKNTNSISGSVTTLPRLQRIYYAHLENNCLQIGNKDLSTPLVYECPIGKNVQITLLLLSRLTNVNCNISDYVSLYLNGEKLSSFELSTDRQVSFANCPLILNAGDKLEFIADATLTGCSISMFGIEEDVE